MVSEIEFLQRGETEQRDIEWRLTVVIEQRRRASYEQAKQLDDWAMRRAQPNAKFDDEWKID
jgi:hypothetical protein